MQGLPLSVCLSVCGFSWDASLKHVEQFFFFFFAKFSQLSLSCAALQYNGTLPLSMPLQSMSPVSPCHLLFTHLFLLLSGLMASTWSTYKGSRASSSSVKQRKQRGSGWSNLTWRCELLKNAFWHMHFWYIHYIILEKVPLPFKIGITGLKVLGFFLYFRSNIKPDRATANQHNFQMHTFDKNTNCRACKMLLR